MSKAQRRDHKPALQRGTLGRPYRCDVCGGPVQEVYNRSLPVQKRHYWRHQRQS